MIVCCRRSCHIKDKWLKFTHTVTDVMEIKAVQPSDLSLLLLQGKENKSLWRFSYFFLFLVERGRHLSMELSFINVNKVPSQKRNCYVFSPETLLSLQPLKNNQPKIILMLEAYFGLVCSAPLHFTRKALQKHEHYSILQ